MTTKTLSDEAIAQVLGEHKDDVEKLVVYFLNGYGFADGVAAVGEWVFQATFQAKNPQLGFVINMDHCKARTLRAWSGLVDILNLDVHETRSTLSQLTLAMVEALSDVVWAVSSLQHKQSSFYAFMRKLDSDALFVPLGNLEQALRQL